MACGLCFGIRVVAAAILAQVWVFEFVVCGCCFWWRWHHPRNRQQIAAQGRRFRGGDRGGRAAAFPQRRRRIRPLVRGDPTPVPTLWSSPSTRRRLQVTDRRGPRPNHCVMFVLFDWFRFCFRCPCLLFCFCVWSGLFQFATFQASLFGPGDVVCGWTWYDRVWSVWVGETPDLVLWWWSSVIPGDTTIGVWEPWDR